MGVQIKCPNCGRRLFDINEKTIGIINIKCSKCKKITQVELDKSIVCYTNVMLWRQQE